MDEDTEQCCSQHRPLKDRVLLQLSRHVSAGTRPQPAGARSGACPSPLATEQPAGPPQAAGFAPPRRESCGATRRPGEGAQGRGAPPRSRPPSAGGGRSGRGRGRVFCGAAGASRPGVAPRRESACPPRGWSLGSARLGPRLLLPLPAAEPSSGKGGAGSPLHSPQSRVSENQPGSGPGPSPASEGPSGPGPHRAFGPGASAAVAAGQGSARLPSRRLPAEPGRLLAPSPPRRRAPAVPGPEARSVAAARPARVPRRGPGVRCPVRGVPLPARLPRGNLSRPLFPRREAAGGVCGGAAPRPMLLPAWEMCLYGLLAVGSHLYAFYEAHQVSQSKSAVRMCSLAPAALPARGWRGCEA